MYAYPQALTQLRESGDGEGVVEYGSWEEEMVMRLYLSLSRWKLQDNAFLAASHHKAKQS